MNTEARAFMVSLCVVIGAYILCTIALRFAGVDFSGAAAVVITLAAAHWQLHRQRTDWKGLGLTRPTSMVRSAGVAVGVVVLGFFAAAIAQAFAIGVLHWSPPDTSRYGEISGNLPRLIALSGIAWTTAALGEELLFRGFVLTRLELAMSSMRGATFAAVVLQALLFGLAHGFQGPTGVLTSAVTGLVLGATYARRRNLWEVIVAHGMTDTIGLLAVYFGSSHRA